MENFIKVTQAMTWLESSDNDIQCNMMFKSKNIYSRQ